MYFDWGIKTHLPTLQQHENNFGQALIIIGAAKTGAFSNFIQRFRRFSVEHAAGCLQTGWQPRSTKEFS